MPVDSYFRKRLTPPTICFLVDPKRRLGGEANDLTVTDPTCTLRPLARPLPGFLLGGSTCIYHDLALL